jgi:hypothetical protein
MTYKPKERILTTEELCKWWGLTIDQLDRLRRDEDLPYLALSRGVYIFSEKRLIQWVEHNMKHRYFPGTTDFEIDDSKVS